MYIGPPSYLNSLDLLSLISDRFQRALVGKCSEAKLKVNQNVGFEVKSHFYSIHERYRPRIFFKERKAPL